MITILASTDKGETDMGKYFICLFREIYMSPLDHHIMSWHFANLEFANAAPLTALSLKHWDQDDEFEFTGHHLAMRSGYSEVPESLAKGVDIRFRIAGQSIRYSNEGEVLLTKQMLKDWVWKKNSIYTSFGLFCSLSSNFIEIYNTMVFC